jgi:hypothetical protein
MWCPGVRVVTLFDRKEVYERRGDKCSVMISRSRDRMFEPLRKLSRPSPDGAGSGDALEPWQTVDVRC